MSIPNNANLADYADLVTFSTIKSGSVVISGSSTPADPSPSAVLAATSSISSGLGSSSTIGGLHI
jgi:hypothetical protein